MPVAVPSRRDADLGGPRSRALASILRRFSGERGDREGVIASVGIGIGIGIGSGEGRPRLLSDRLADRPHRADP